MNKIMPLKYWLMFLGGIAVIGISVFAVIKITGSHKTVSKQEENIEELGSIADIDDCQDLVYSEGDDEYSYPTGKVSCYFSNWQLITNLLTIDQTTGMYNVIGEWLQKNGYKENEIVELTIIEDSIVNDPTYPYFRFKTPDKTTYAFSYRSDTGEYKVDNW